MSLTIRVETFEGKARSIETLFGAVLLFLIGFLLVELQRSHILSSWWLRGRGCFVTLGAITLRIKIFSERFLQEKLGLTKCVSMLCLS